MNRLLLGALLGVAVGVVDVLIMLPLKFQDRTSALLGAFCARFALGFFAATVRLPLSPIAKPLISLSFANADRRLLSLRNIFLANFLSVVATFSANWPPSSISRAVFGVMLQTAGNAWRVVIPRR